MPTINVRGITGIPELNIDAKGFAEESTLKSLVAALTGQASTTGRRTRELNEQLRDAASNTGDLSDAFIDLTDDVEDSSWNLSKFSKAGAAAQNTMSSLGRGFSDLASASDSGTISLRSVVSTVSDIGTTMIDAVGDVIKGFPVIGEAVAGLTTGLASAALQIGSAATGFVIGQLEGLRSTQRALYDSGVYFTRGIDDAAELAGEAGTTIGAMSKAAQDAKESLRLFDGGAAVGARKVTLAFGKLGTAGQELLYSYGYTQEEILAGIADFGASAAMAGKDLTIDELAAASTEYLTNLKDLERLSGKSVKEQEAAIEANRRNIAFQEYLKTLNPQVAKGVENFIASLSPAEAEIAKARMMGYQLTEPKLLYIQNNVPGMVSAFDSLKQAAEDGTLNVNTMDTMFGELRAKSKAGIDSFIESFAGADPKQRAGYLGQLMQSQGMMTDILTDLGEMRIEADKTSKAFKDSSEKLDPEKLGPLNKAISDLTALEVDLSNRFQKAAIKMTDIAVDYTKALSGMFEEMRKMAGGGAKSEAALTLEKAIEEIKQTRAYASEGRSGEYRLETEFFNDKYQNLTANELAMQGVRREEALGGTTYIYDPKLVPQSTPSRDDRLTGKAVGGPVARGEDYLVGEAGPELFRPSTDGQIIPTGTAIPVRISGNAELGSMVNKLDSLISVNRAMLQAMQQSNSINRNAAMYAR